MGLQVMDTGGIRGMGRSSGSRVRVPLLSFNAWLRFPYIRRFLDGLDATSEIVEVGCGQGAMATYLAQRFHYLGFEPDTLSFQVTEQRLERLGRGRVENTVLPSLPASPVDALFAFEVLEHLEEDALALQTWARWLRPGGSMVLSVPANPERFGPSDEWVGHYRRYSRSLLTDLLFGVGAADVTVYSYGFPLGYLLEAVRNRVAVRAEYLDKEAATAASGRRLQPDERLAWIARYGTWPFRLMQRPFRGTDVGTGLVARAVMPR